VERDSADPNAGNDLMLRFEFVSQRTEDCDRDGQPNLEAQRKADVVVATSGGAR
jgi:hypothetical protein